MKTNVHPNSVDSFFDMVESGKLGEQKSKVIRALHKTPGLTRKTISTTIGIEYTSACARVRELLDDGLIVEVGATKNKSGATAATLALKEKFYQ